ncbi:MAG: hypothetical protein K2Y51_25965 [Gammaproteobacteria bacterium]|nr:hypothetical protein [Gammaproteobacteria bacterium]
MSAVKPGIGRTELTEGWASRIQTVVEIIAGRRGRKAQRAGLTSVLLDAAGPAPTAADYNKVVSDLNTLAARYNELLEQVQD